MLCASKGMSSLLFSFFFFKEGCGLSFIRNLLFFFLFCQGPPNHSSPTTWQESINEESIEILMVVFNI